MAVQIIGNCISISKENDTLNLLTDTHFVQIAIAKCNAFRISFGLKNAIPYQPSIAVENTAIQNLITEESDSRISILLYGNILHIDLKPIRLTFATKHGDILLENDPGLGFATQNFTSTAYWKLQNNEHFVGLGEKASNINKRGLQFTNWNTDAFAYNSESDPLYASIPFYQAENNGNWYGIFVDQTERTDFNFGASNHRFSFFRSHSQCLTFYFFPQNNLPLILEAYSNLTGKTPLPPLWALGYQQCRYSYYPDSELQILAKTFRAKKLPADVLYLDIHYMDAYKVFTFHPEHFPEPTKLIQNLTELGFEAVPIIDPGIKIEKQYQAYESGLKQKHFLQYPDGDTYIGEAWPGKCHFPDFTKPETRQWWANQIAEMAALGINGFWNDMNEPAVWGKHFPDLIPFDLDGNPSDHLKAHNVYGQYMAMATKKGAETGRPNTRIFMLTRAAFAGIQKTATLWTGDNISNEEHFWAGIRLVLNLGLSGVPFCGNDVGGFIGEAWPQLFARWIQVAAFMPFFRGHTMVNSRDAEPWSFGEETEEISRNYLNLRYRLMPQWYQWMHQTSTLGVPVCKPLFVNFPKQKNAFNNNYQHQFMVGSQLLVCPIAPSQNFLKVWLPENEQNFWYHFLTDQIYQFGEHIIAPNNNELPIFVLPGSVIIAQNTVQNTKEMQQTDCIHLHVYLDAKASSSTYWYMDDGHSLNYQNQDFVKREIHFEGKLNELVIEEQTGKMETNVKYIKIYFHGINTDFVQINSQITALTTEKYRWVNPISNFDPYFSGLDERLTIESLKFLEIPLEKNKITISW